MKTCAREQQIVQALTTDDVCGALPADVQEHLRACANCREVAAIASALLSDTNSADEDGPAPSADIVWFRAQMKARAEAAELAARPVFLVQALAAAGVVGGVAGVAVTLGSLDIAAIANRGILLAFAVWLLIAPVAVYLATTED